MLKREEINKISILDNLSKGICKVIFRKVTDGRYRSMMCTLNESYIPTKFETGVRQLLKMNKNDFDLIPVYDIIKGNWRSFYVNSIELFYTPEDLKENKEVTKLKKEKQNENNRE